MHTFLIYFLGAETQPFFSRAERIVSCLGLWKFLRKSSSFFSSRKSSGTNQGFRKTFSVLLHTHVDLVCAFKTQSAAGLSSL